MIYALCRKIDFVENLRVFGVKIWTEISIRVKNLTFSMSGWWCLDGYRGDAMFNIYYLRPSTQSLARFYIWSATWSYPSLSLIWWWWYPDNYHDVMFNIDLWSATWTLSCLSVLALRALGICNLINYSRSVWWSKNQENINIMITTMIIIHDDLCSPPGPWLMNRRPLSDTVDWETSNTCNII